MHLPNSQSNETFTGLHLQARIFVNDYFSTDLRPKVLPNSCCLCSKAEVFFIKSETSNSVMNFAILLTASDVKIALYFQTRKYRLVKLSWHCLQELVR